MPNLNLILLFYIFLFERAAKTQKLNGAQWQTDSHVEHLTEERGFPKGYPRTVLPAAAPLLHWSLATASTQGCAFLSLCTPAIHVNILISEPSAANHILTFKRRFITSGKVKKKYEINFWELCSNKQEWGRGEMQWFPPPTPRFSASSLLVMNASEVVVQAWMCLPFPQVTAVFIDTMFDLAWRICFTLKFFAGVECICIVGIEYLCILGATL